MSLSNRRLRVVSDGTPRGTAVLDANGDAVKWGGAGLVKIEIRPIEPNDKLIVAVFTVSGVGLDVDLIG